VFFHVVQINSVGDADPARRDLTDCSISTADVTVSLARDSQATNSSPVLSD
jgi:hypothetical protein